MAYCRSATAFRSIRRVEQPAVEPISVAEAKTHLGISPEVAEHDAYLAGLIASARIAAEARLSMTLTATRWRAVREGGWGCGCGAVEMPYPPLLVDADHPLTVEYRGADGSTVAVDAADIETDTVDFPGRLRVRGSIPSGGCCEVLSTVTWWAGVVSPHDVPAPVRTAILRMVARMFGDRGDTAESILTNDQAVAHLLAACSWGGRY